MLCELVRTTAADGVRLDGALVPGDSNPANKLKLDVLVCLHGVASNFYGSTLFENLAPSLRLLGLPLLLANTRGHDTVYATASLAGRRWLGAAFEAVDECRLDIAAWCDLLVARGYSRIGLMGHSLGAIKAVYSQAHAASLNVPAVVAISPPRLSYAGFRHGSEGAAFYDAIATAQEHIAAGRHDALMKVKVPFPMMMSAAGYLEKYGPEERYNILKFVNRLTCPALFSYGGMEVEQGGIAFAGVPEALKTAASADQVLDVVTIAGADHNYTHTHQPLAEQIASWLVKHF